MKYKLEMNNSTVCHINIQEAICAKKSVEEVYSQRLRTMASSNLQGPRVGVRDTES